MSDNDAFGTAPADTAAQDQKPTLPMIAIFIAIAAAAIAMLAMVTDDVADRSTADVSDETTVELALAAPVEARSCDEDWSSLDACGRPVVRDHLACR